MSTFTNQPWQSQNWNAPYQPQFTTNILYVTSPEEALMKTTQRNCEVIYFHQDKPEFYRVRVDAEGRKMWQGFSYVTPDPSLTEPVMKADIIQIMNRLQSLEDRLKSTETVGEVNHGEPNG